MFGKEVPGCIRGVCKSTRHSGFNKTVAYFIQLQQFMTINKYTVTEGHKRFAFETPRI